MKLLANLLPETFESETFYWNLYGSDEELPNFWYKPTNIQIEWYRDDPARAPFSNIEDSFDDAFGLLLTVREDYGDALDGK